MGGYGLYQADVDKPGHRGGTPERFARGERAKMLLRGDTVGVSMGLNPDTELEEPDMQTNLTPWDYKFLSLAKFLSGWSKDPSTKVGCVIADHRHRIVGTGFNGFAAGVKDTDERLNNRDTKLLLTIHAERNALAFATRDVEGCTAYVWPLPPCSPCAAALCQEHIGRVVAPEITERHSDWKIDYDLAKEMYQEAGVITDFEVLPPDFESLLPAGEIRAYHMLSEAERIFRETSRKGVTLAHRQLKKRADLLGELLARWSL